MKKNVWVIFAVPILFGTFFLVWVILYNWKNLKGLKPAIGKPSQDISKMIEESSKESRAAPQNTTDMPLTLPLGFSISIFAKDLGAPRVLAWDPSGILLASIPSQGRVVALPDRNNDGVADEIITVRDNLSRPHGLAFQCKDTCKLYISEENQVAVYDYDRKNLKATNKKKIVDLPFGGNHWSRTIMFAPPPNDDKLLIAVGSSCNVCNEKDFRRTKILIANSDGSNLSEFASGLRNAVFMTTHPITKKVWVSEMGRDLLGDDLPPDEINIIEKGRNYGWPYCYGKNIHDPFGGGKSESICKDAIPSYIDIPAHSAPLGLVFIPEKGWRKEYHYNLLVAYHGSWNRSVPTGYKIVRYKLDRDGRYQGMDSTGSPQVEDFISGWLKDGEALGRPVDILMHPDGNIFISDDKAGVIYLVQYVQIKIYE